MKTQARTRARCTDLLFWTCLGSLLLIAVRVANPSPEAYLASIGAVLVGVAACLLDRDGGRPRAASEPLDVEACVPHQ